MSYESENVLAPAASLSRVQELISLLGFKKAEEELDIPGRIASYYWYDETDYRSWSGVSLRIYREGAGPLKIYMRSSASRSFWDLKHQNITLKLLRDAFGGHFTSDAGRNRVWRAYGPIPKPLTSGCYLARWRFHNGLGRAHIYLMNREFVGKNAKDEPSGLWVIDEVNPRLLSNNFLLPYVIAVWEEYFRSTFAAALRYSKEREAALKRARLSHAHLEQVALGAQPIERAIAESFSFQRPSVIAENFRLLDPKLDLGNPLRKPYRRRRVPLYESIAALVEDRNALVHNGRMNMTLFDKPLQTVLKDIEVAVDRCYHFIAAHYGFTAITDY